MTPITFAHRGGAADQPENSLGAFAAAKARGATGIESDVHVSADGVPVLAHTPNLRRGLRRIAVARLAAADLAGLGVPALSDLYRTVGSSLEVSLDLKTPGSGTAVLEVARKFRAERRLWLCSPDLETLSALRAPESPARLVHSSTRRAIFETMERHAATLAESGVHAMNMHRTEWTTGLVTLFHRFGILAFAWDAQEVRHLREVLRYGIDAVYSDHVDRMVAVVAEFAGGVGAAERLQPAELPERPDSDERLADDR